MVLIVDSRAKLFASLFVVSLITCLSSGLIFGWSSLLLIYNREGVHSERCNGEPAPCDASNLRLSLIYTVSAAVFVFSTPFIGLALVRAPRTRALFPVASARPANAALTRRAGPRWRQETELLWRRAGVCVDSVARPARTNRAPL